MKALGRVLFLAGAVAIGLFLFRAAPRDVTLVYGLQGGPASQRLEVEIDRGAEAVRRAEFRVDPGAASTVRHRVRLPDGDYVLHLTLGVAGQPPRRLERSITVSESGTIVIPVAW